MADGPTARTARPVEVSLSPDTRISDWETVEGHQRSHRIPQALESHSFYEAISEATNANGRQVFDLQRVQDNGQRLPSNSQVTQEYIDPISQHRGSHPRINDLVQDLFDAWQIELDNALNGVTDVDVRNSKLTIFAQRTQDLSDLIAMLSIGGMADPDDVTRRLIYNRTDPNAASLAAPGVWQTLNADQQNTLIRQNIDALLGDYMDLQTGALNAAGRARLEIMRDLTLGWVGELQPRHAALIDELARYAVENDIDLSQRNALDLIDENPQRFADFTDAVDEFRQVQRWGTRFAGALMLDLADGAFSIVDALEMAGTATALIRGDVGFDPSLQGNFDPLEYTLRAAQGDRWLPLTSIAVPAEVQVPPGATTYNTAGVMQWIRDNIALPPGLVWQFENTGPGSLPTAVVDDPTTPGWDAIQVSYRVIPNTDGIQPGQPAAFSTRVLQDGDVLFEDYERGEATRVRPSEGMSGQQVADLIGAYREATTPEARQAALAALRDAGLSAIAVETGGTPLTAPQAAVMGMAIRTGNPLLAALASGWRSLFDGTVTYADLGGILASQLMRALPIEDPWARIGVSTGLATILTNMGESLDFAFADGSTLTASAALNRAFDDFSDDLIQSGVGAISSYLLGEALADLGLSGETLEVAQAFAGPVLGKVAYNLIYLGQTFTKTVEGVTYYVNHADQLLNSSGQVVQSTQQAAVYVPGSTPPAGASRTWNTGLSGQLFVTVAASFIGSKLADSIVQFDTVGGQIGAAIGEGIGSIIAAKILSAGASGGPWTFVAAVLVVAIAKIVGGALGSLFGGTPKAGAALGWDESDERFEVGRVWSKNGGSKDAVRGMATQVSDVLNGVIAVTGAKVVDAGGVRTGAYDLKGDRFIYKANMAAGYAYSSKDASKVVNHGAFIALCDLSERLIGGDIFVKRALAATVAQAGGAPFSYSQYAAADFSVDVLLGNVGVAQSYSYYWTNRAAIDAMIAADPLAAVSATWAVTLAAGIDLGLNRRFGTDWLGGWSAFLDGAADGETDGRGFTPGQTELHFIASTGERLFIFTDANGGALYLNDTVDAESKTRIGGSASADTIELVQDSWNETRVVTDTVTLAADRTFLNKQTNSLFAVDPAIVFNGTPISLGEGLLLTGAETVSVTRTVTVARSGWRVEQAAGLVIDGAIAATGPSGEVRIAAVVDGGGGSDTIRGGDLGNDLLGGEGDDTLIGGALDDWLFGGEGADKLFAGAVADVNAVETTLVAADGGNGDYLDGGAGNDLIYGGKGSDWLSGGEGSDRLVGGAGGDVLDAGAGDDRGASGEASALGGAGSDQYVFGVGYGHDVIFDESDAASGPGGTDTFAARMTGFAAGTQAKNWAGGGEYVQNGDVRGGEDAIVFAPGIDISNLVLKRSGTAQAPGNDLIISLQVEVNGVMTLTGDDLTIKDWFNQTRRIEWFRFADGEDIRIGDLSSFTLGTGGNDVIIGTSGADFVVAGEGDDTVYTLAGNDFGFGGSGADFISGDGDNDMVAGGTGDDIVTGGTGLDTVFGDAGDDQIYGGGDSDILAGGKGNDLVVTGSGNDYVRYQRGDGRDVVIDEYVNNWETVSQNGVYVNGYALQSDGTVTKGGQVYFDGTEWLGQYEWVQQTNTLRRQLGSVNGAIAANSGVDTLEFGFGIDIQNLEFRRTGNDLDIAIRLSDSDVTRFEDVGDHILIKDWYAAGALASIEKFVFTEVGTVLTSSWIIGAGTAGADTMTGVVGVDWMTGSDGDDTLDGAGGADVLYGGNDHDSIKGGEGADVLYGGDGSDVLNGGAGADLLFGGAGIDIASYANSSAAVIATLGPLEAGNGEASGDKYTDIEGLEGSALGDTLSGNANANVLRGLAGADLLRGGAGDDIYEFQAGSGADVINEGELISQEVVSAAGVLASGYTATWTFLGSEVDYDSNWKPPYKSWGWYRLVVTQVINGQTVEVYRSNDYDDFEYYGTNIGAKPLPSPTVWPFYAGQWKNGVARTGNGYQVGREVVGSGEGGADTIEFGSGISLAQLSFTRENSGADLRITYGVTDSILIANQATGSKAVEQIHLEDGLVIDLATVRAGGEAATPNADSMFGTSLANTLSGGDGDDILSGAAGDDTLEGGAGNDVIEGGAGADLLNGGNDEQTSGVALEEAQGNWGDTIRYVTSSAGVTVDLTSTDPTDSTRSLAFSGGDAAGDRIVRVGGYSSIEHIVGSNFADTLTGDVRHNRLQGLDGIDTIYGRSGDDVISGGAGGDFLYGEAGADNIIGGDGNDTVNGGDGDDIVAGDAGDDTLSGLAGDDTLLGGDGVDLLIGSTGDDILAGGEGDDTLQGQEDDDQLAGEAGNDTLQGGVGDDELVGGLGNDSLQGGGDNDTYVFERGDGVDTIVDTSGVNTIQLVGIASSSVWITRVGNDLKIGVIGVDPAAASITVSNYFASSSPGLMKSISTADATIYLAFAGPLITAMTNASVTPPGAMPQAITDMLVAHWHVELPAPVVLDQHLQASFNTPLSGSVAAVDHDQDIVSYSVVDAADHGTVVLSPTTGTWTYTPGADWAGSDVFKIKVTDQAGHEVIQSVAVETLSPTSNVAPSTPTIVSQALTSVQDNAANGQLVATLSANDLNGTTPSFRIKNGPNAWFEIVGNEVRLKSNVPLIDFGTTPTLSVQVEAWDGALASSSVRTVSVNVIETNTAPSIAAQTFSPVAENMPGAGQTVVGTVIATDLDDFAGNKALRYELTGGATSVFQINPATGQILLHGQLNYEALSTYSLTVRAWDGGAVGQGLASSPVNLTINVADVNEAPQPIFTQQQVYIPHKDIYNSWTSLTFSDPDTYAPYQTTVASVVISNVIMGATSITATFTGTQISFSNGATASVVRVGTTQNWKLDTSGEPEDLENTEPSPPPFNVVLAVTDSAGIARQVTAHFAGNEFGLAAPIVLDLDGDGLELSSIADRQVYFDMDKDGVRERTGWVGADDGMLVLDRNSDGLITNRSEIAFDDDIAGGQTDLEGLSSFDSNFNGRFDAGDERFAEFQIWRDLNQDGISQIGELSSLTSLGVTAISLTISETGAVRTTDDDNLIVGTTVFFRADGSSGEVGDVILTYVETEGSFDLVAELLPPIVFDLNGDGVQLLTRAQSVARFDADADGDVERTGWFSAADGVLALDRNGDGVINNGLEISFKQDLEGAVTDLEGLAAYDGDRNGRVDIHDAGYAAFLLWQDANGNGVSEEGELSSLAAAGIASIGLTRSEGPTNASGGNVVHAYGTFVRSDGRVGVTADVSLAYDSDVSETSETGPSRTADARSRAKPFRSQRTTSPFDWIREHSVEPDDDSIADWLRRHSVWGKEDRSGVHRPRLEHANVPLVEPASESASPSIRTGSALHSGLNLADKRVLHMVNAMAAFDARGGVESLGRKRDPRVAELLTSLPDLR